MIAALVAVLCDAPLSSLHIHFSAFMPLGPKSLAAARWQNEMSDYCDIKYRKRLGAGSVQRLKESAGGLCAGLFVGSDNLRVKTRLQRI